MAAAFFTPLAFNPHGPTMRWAGVVTVNPDVAVTVPPMISRDPDPALVRRCRNDFDGARWRWAYADDNLRVSHSNR